MSIIKDVLDKVPFLERIAVKIYHQINPFPGSETYWKKRYEKGGNSGSGSYDRLANFKAEVLNSFVKEKNVQSVIEFGCGDGNQLSLANYPKYIGMDVAEVAIQICKEKFKKDKTKEFFIYPSDDFINNPESFKCDLSLSIDVIFHLTEDEVYEKHMNDLFQSAKRHVIIYSSNINRKQTYHERDREILSWIKKNIKDWKFVKKIDNKYKFDSSNPEGTSKCDFFFFEKSREVIITIN